MRDPYALRTEDWVQTTVSEMALAPKCRREFRATNPNLSKAADVRVD